MDTNNIQKSADENHNNSNSTELIARERIGKTDLEIIGNEEKGYFIALGKYKLTESFPRETLRGHKITLQELALDILEEYHWDIVINLIAISTEWAKLDILNHLEKYGVPTQDKKEI